MKTNNKIIDMALSHTSEAMNKTEESDAAIEAIIERVFPDGSPKEAGSMLGAYNMLNELLRTNESIRSNLSQERANVMSLIQE